MPSIDVLEQIRKEGAQAHLMGKTPLDNPFYDRNKMPSATGESHEEWQAKIMAWEDGWKKHCAMDAHK